MSVYDPRACRLGEGALWHPTRKELFWFDILNRKLMSLDSHWGFDEMVSAAGWVDYDHLLIASETQLFRFNLETGHRDKLADLEADLVQNRSNDGRADPKSGFWIGTMGKNGEARSGAFYRFYKGELRKLFGDLTITNSCCFAPDGSRAYFSDTAQGIVFQVDLDIEGWPVGEPQKLLDFSGRSNPDGAVTDAAGNLWIAFWGRGCVEGFDLTGRSIGIVNFPASQTSCPAFGGKDFGQLFCTSAAVGLDPVDRHDGQVFRTDAPVTGRAEPQVLL